MPRIPRNAGAARIAALALLACASTQPNAAALAAAFVPGADDVVLEHLPRLPDDGTAELRRRVEASPGDLDAAIELASAYASRARLTQDSRWAGYAEAVIEPWRATADPPAELLVVRGTLAQHRHAFDAARADLQAAVARAPQDPRAQLGLATVLLVQGEPVAALERCGALARIALPVVTATCQAAAALRSGRAALAATRLDLVIGDGAEVPVGLAAWVFTTRAEAAAAQGRADEAETWLRRAVATDPTDAYGVLALADHLLDAGRAAEVPALVEDDLANDGKLLRFVLALRAMGDPRAAENERNLRDRFAAARLRGDSVAQREEARLLLATGEVRGALDLARANWAVQKEPADARVLLEAALAAGDRKAAADCLAWLRATSIENPELAALAAQLVVKAG